jgi:hypothetical protein
VRGGGDGGDFGGHCWRVVREWCYVWLLCVVRGQVERRMVY